MGCARALNVLAPAVLLLAGCSPATSTLPPYAEALLEIDTNLRVPLDLSRVRVDLFDAERRWTDTRDFATPGPSSFPLSFSLYTDREDRGTTAWVRVRGYGDGRLRDYLGERFEGRPVFSPPVPSQSLFEACRDAPELALGAGTTLRLRSRPFVEQAAELICEASAGGFAKHTRSGLAVARFRVPTRGDYRVAIIQAEPGRQWQSVADPVLSLRTACDASASELACNDDEREELAPLSGLQRELDPGEYFVLAGNVAQGPMDVTLLVESALDSSTLPVGGPPELTPGEPRLLVDGVDVTPATEPDPALAVDRLLRVELQPGQRGTARVLLDGACLGTMANWDESLTCIEDEGALEAVVPLPLEPGVMRSTVTRAGTWAAYLGEPCPPEVARTVDDPLTDRTCVPGGTFLLGDPTLIARGADAGTPQRFATLPRFWMDRFEYTVGRYRAQRARGFVPPDVGPFNNFEPLALDEQELTRACSWSESLDRVSPFPEREDLPLTCVSWLSAEALCEWEGGRLPSVAEREYAASASGRAAKQAYPWGARAPGCDEAVFGRWFEPSHGNSSCYDSVAMPGPLPVDAKPWMVSDRTPDGLVGLGGNVAEWTRDSHRSYADACWRSQPARSPSCDEAEAPLRTIAGGSWRSSAPETRAARRVGGAAAGLDPWVGFRCVYDIASP